jgi:hypothetical protein
MTNQPVAAIINLSSHKESNNFRRTKRERGKKDNKVFYSETLDLFSLWGDT